MPPKPRRQRSCASTPGAPGALLHVGEPQRGAPANSPAEMQPETEPHPEPSPRPEPSQEVCRARGLADGVQEVWIGCVGNVEQPIGSEAQLRNVLVRALRNGRDENAKELFAALGEDSAAENTVEFNSVVKWFVEKHGCSYAEVEQLSDEDTAAEAVGGAGGGGVVEAEPPETPVWAWRGDIVPGSGRQDKWVAYPRAKSREIERAFDEAMRAKKHDPKKYEADKARTVVVDAERYIDLKSMAQRRKDDPTARLRLIRRRGILYRGWLEEKSGQDVWTTRAAGQADDASDARVWRKRWAVLYGDGYLSCYAQPPGPEDVLPHCPPQSTVQLRLPSGECCRVETAAFAGKETEFVILLPKQPSKGHQVKNFRLKDDLAALSQLKTIITDSFGPSAVLPKWVPGHEWILAREKPETGAEDLASRIVEVELRPDSNHWHRGTVIKFCNGGLRALASAPMLAGLRAGLLSSVVEAVGATPHLIRYDAHGEIETELERENNGKLHFRVATNPSIVTVEADGDGGSHIGIIGLGSDFVGLRWRVQKEYSQASHSWEVQIRPQGQNQGLDWKPVAEGGCKVDIKPPPEDDSPTASLFDLGSKSEDVCESREYPAEWRFVEEVDRDTVPNSTADRLWECIIRGLPPSTVYRVRVRSFVRELEQEGRGSGHQRTVHGAWSEIATVMTIASNPPKHRLLDSDILIAAGPADRNTRWTTERVQGVTIRKGELGLASRWFRVRQPQDWEDGMEVLWRCKPQSESQLWKVNTSIETPADVTENGKHSVGTIEESGLNLCGRVSAGAGEIIHVECDPVDGLDTVMDYSYVAIRRQDMLQREPAAGRYVYIRHATKPLSVVDIQVFDTSGVAISIVEAAMSSSHNWKPSEKVFRTFPASNVIDGKTTTCSRTKGLDQTRREAWLRVDLGADHNIGKVNILARVDKLKEGNCLEGAVVSITPDRAGQSKTWESPEVPDECSLLLTYTWLCMDGAVEQFEPEPESKATDEALNAGVQEYPEPDFNKLHGWLKLLAGVEEVKGSPDSAALPLPSRWVNLEGDGVLMPFSDTTRAKSFRVKRQFSSKAKPYWVELAEGTDGSGKILSLVMKYGDDLRQDQLVLSMFALFNQIWREVGAMHNTFTGTRVHAEAPIYRVARCGYERGFVEMLPDSEPVDDIAANPRRGENGWKQSNEIVPSAVAGFMLIYLLNIRDRHQGNMVVTGGNRFANIDFGWLAEGPSLDAGLFPIPDGLHYLLTSTNLWAEFHDLSWDTLKVLHESFDRIETAWKRLLRDLELNDGFLFNTMPGDMEARLSIPRSQLDMELRKFSIGTYFKNISHEIGNKWKAFGGGASVSGPTEATAAAQKRLDHRLSSPSLVVESPAKVAAGGDLVRTSTESLQSWLQGIHLAEWHDSLVKQNYDQVSFLVSSSPATLDTVLAEIQMPLPHIEALKAAILKDPGYVAR